MPPDQEDRPAPRQAQSQIAALRKQIQDQQTLKQSLQERVKELNCLYSFLNLLADPNLDEPGLLQKTVDLIPPAWQHPEITTARITLEDREFTSTPFEESNWKLSADITIDKQIAGSIDIYYLGNPLDSVEEPFLKEERELLDTLAMTLEQNLERKRSQRELDQISWMLSGQTRPSVEYDYQPEYGDLSELNTNGTIISNVEKEQLRDIVSEYLDLLGTSAAVYESDGSYALGIFSSGWCQRLDAASRRLCHTGNNQEALNSGKWLCHDSCWKEASLESIKRDQAVDIECEGGIHLYAVPVKVGGEIIGSINFGYGDPPRDSRKLKELSQKYQLPVEELVEQASAYHSRPDFLIEYAKKRLEKAAGYLGHVIALSQTERSLKEREEHLQITLNSIGDAVITTDVAGYVTGMNPVAERLTGWKHEQAMQQKLSTVFKIENARTGKRLPDPAEKVLESGSIVGLANHTRLRSKDGQEYLISDSGAPIRDDADNLKGVVLVFRDETENYRMVEELQASEARFRSTLDALLEGCQILDSDFRYRYLNQAAARQARKAPDALSGRNMSDFFPEDQNPDLYRHLRTCLAEQVSLSFENEFQYPDGSTGWFDLSIHPVPEGLFILSIDISKRKEAEQSLRTSKEKYQQRIEDLLEGFYSATVEGTLLEYNREFVRILGLDPGKDHTGTKLPLFWQDPADRTEYIRLLFEQGYVRDYQINARKAGGESMYVRVNARIIPDDEGHPRQIEGSFVDDTERTELETHLEKSERKFRLIADNSIDCIWQLDKQLRFTYLSPSLYDIAGFRPEEWLGTRISEHTTMKEFFKMGRLALRMLREHQKFNHVRFETWMFNHDKELIPLEIVARPLMVDGELIGLQGSTRDIRDRIEAAQKLRENEQFLRDIIETMTDGFSILDAGGKHTDVNPAFCAMTGFSEGELIGVPPPHPYWPEEEYDHIQEAFSRAQRGDASNVELVFKKKTGARFPVIVSPSQIRDPNGNLISTFATIKDISDRKQAENELRRLKNELEIQVEEQTRELQKRLAELQRFHDATIEREFRIKELRDELNQLKGQGS